jgi:hypothetical protein
MSTRRHSACRRRRSAARCPCPAAQRDSAPHASAPLSPTAHKDLIDVSTYTHSLSGRAPADGLLLLVLLAASVITGGVCVWVTVEAPAAGRTFVAWYGGAAAVLLCAAVTVAAYSTLAARYSYADAVGNQAYMSFSHGEHGCPFPAQGIAATIAQAGIEVLLGRLPDVRLAVAADALVWRPSVWMRGLSALPVKFTPAYVTGGVGQG